MSVSGKDACGWTVEANVNRDAIECEHNSQKMPDDTLSRKEKKHKHIFFSCTCVSRDWVKALRLGKVGRWGMWGVISSHASQKLFLLLPITLIAIVKETQAVAGAHECQPHLVFPVFILSLLAVIEGNSSIAV